MEYLYVMLFVCYASYAYNRRSAPFSMPKLKEEGLDISHAGLITSCQNMAFSFSKFAAGMLSDRLNPLLMFTTGLLVSGFATILFSSSSSIAIFCSLCFINGLAQGCGWPSCAKILRQRASPSRFGTLWSILSSSNNVSGSLGPLLSAAVMIQFGWRWSVFLAGAISVFLGILLLFSIPFLPDISSNQTQDKARTGSDNKNSKMNVFDLFSDPFIWQLSLGFMVVFCARTTTVDWGQLYLMEERKHTQYTASAFMSSVETGGFVGRIAAGYITDWVIKQNTSSKEVTAKTKISMRMSVAMLFMFGIIMSIHLFQFSITETSSLLWITCIGAFMGMCFYGPIAIFGIVSSESVPSSLSGSSHAIVSLFGNLGAALSGLPFGYIAKHYKWATVFFMLEILSATTLLVLFCCRNIMPKRKDM